MALLLLCYAGSRVAEARAVAPTEEFIVYSIPRRSAVGFWQGAAAEFVTPDSLPLNETERTYRLLPGIIRRAARRTAYRVGWRGCTVPVQRLADPDSANEQLSSSPAPWCWPSGAACASASCPTAFQRPPSPRRSMCWCCAATPA